MGQKIIKIFFTSLISAFACTGVIYGATTIGNNISTTGTITGSGANTLYGSTSIGGALTATSTLNVAGLTTLGNASSTFLSIGNTTYIGGANGLILTDGSITDASGAISFGDENIYTTGNIGVGTSSPYAKLSVVGEIVGNYFTATSTTATSTFPKIAITSGSISGVNFTGQSMGGYGGRDYNRKLDNIGKCYGRSHLRTTFL